MAYLTSEARRKQRKALWLIIEIICLVHFAIIVPRDRVFTSEKWAQTPAPMRHKLMWSFHRQYQLEGMTREEVEKLPVIIYPEHDAAYLQECLDNLKQKGIII